MSSLNKVMIIGRLGKDPEVRKLNSGDSVANLTVATSYKSKDTEVTEWHKVTAYGKLAEIVDKYLKKGGLVYFEGRLQTRKWQDKDGKDNYTTEIIANTMQMLGGNPSGQQSSPQPREVVSQADTVPFNDDVPF